MNDPLTDTTAGAHHRFAIPLQRQIKQTVRFNRRPAVQDARISPRHFEQRAFGGAKRQCRTGSKIAFDPELLCHFADQITPDAFGYFDGRNVKRILQGIGQGHIPLKPIGIVLGAPLA